MVEHSIHLVSEAQRSYRPAIDIVPLEPKHLRQIATCLRPADEKEILAVNPTPMRALWRGYKESILRKAAFVDGVIAAVWGCGGELLGTKGCPWLLTTPQVEKISPLAFTRIYQREVRAMLELFPVLENCVDAEYTQSVKLLEMTGFVVGSPVPVGKNAMFRIFTLGV